MKSFLKKVSHLLSDKAYIRLAYFRRLHKFPDLKNPKTFNEKLQWLKIHDRKPVYTTMVDKYEVKKYVSDKIGEQYIIHTLGVWNSFDEIDFDKLPDKFVLKCTHDSGGLVIVKDKKSLDLVAARKKLESSLKVNYYWQGREWPYKNVKPRIIAERYMEDSKTAELRDYKFFCFNGHVKALFVASDRYTDGEETKFDFFDSEFNHLPFKQGHPNAKNTPNKPACFEEMKSLAEQLSVGIPQVRIDFYEVDGRVYFGEYTLFHYSGMIPFVPEEWDKTFGDWIDLKIL